MPRTPFDEFLNSAGPSTPRGRGRGRGGARGGGGRGGRGGGRGGSFGGVSGQSKLSSDYSNVSFDYSNLNTRTYSKLEGSTVAPFGPADKAQNIQNSSPYSTPRGRGSYTPRGRGRGAFGQQNDAARTTPTGAATPVLGLGYNKNGNPNKFKLDKYDKGKQSDRNGQYTSGPKSHHRSGDTVGKQGVFWGGGAAPIFVKAGELFKDGEVDILKVDKEQNIHVERQPLSDPSAPQMIHLQDRVEVELHPEVLAVGEHPDDVVLPEEVDFWTGVAPINPPEKTTIADLPPTAAPPSAGEDVAIPSGVVDPPIMEQPPLLESKVEKTSEGASEVIQETMIVDDIEVEAPAAVVAEAPIPSEDIPAFFIDTEPGPASAPAESVEGATSASEPLFFVDTGPVTVATEVQYHSLTTDRPLGTQLSDGSKSEEEEIILKPRKFGQPKPISVDTTHAGPSRSTAQPPSKPYDATVEEGFISRSFVPPTQLSRRDKKALKKEKRTRNKVKAKKNKKDGKKRGDVYVGSDVEWGSDGPPDHILSVEMELDDGLDSEKDVEILRDYLAGTLLNEATDSEEEDEEEPGEEKMSFNLIRAMATDGNDQDENFEIESGEEDNPDIESDSEDEDSDEGDSIDEDDDSSDIGEIRFQPISNPAQDSSSDEDDIDAIFNGKDSWDETEWFIKNMEEALDGDVDMGNRKARKSVFRAVEQGNFGDDWDVPTEPYKKGKKKALDPYIPAELHSQWEQDRLRKAEKRRLRDLERLVAILDPHPATHSKKDKGKKKQKGSSRVEQAKLAHLIPASAMEIADMFDVPSDVDEGPGSNSINAKMRKILNELLPGGRGLEGVNEGIRKFMKDDGKSTYSVPPMGKEGRMKVHMLAECYGMTSKSRGKGQARFTVLTKTSRTGVRVDEARIARIISAAPQSGGAFYKAFYKGKGGKTGAKGKKGPIDNGASAKAREGETVGFGAERIGMENIGHKLLSRMGWSEGGRIGRSEGGLEQPIVAIVKTTKMGLGA